MKRLHRRTMITLLLTLGFTAGVVFFCVRLFQQGENWVGYFGSTYYTSGVIFDQNGTQLYDGQSGSYAQDKDTRISTLHLVGDKNFGSSLRTKLASRLTGYNPITGTTLGCHDVTLTVDAALNKTAYAALGGHKGVVAMYNYRTGDVLCLVSSPAYDPLNPPADVNENSAYDGVYVNRFFSGTYPPGSTFKLITTAAALEKMEDVEDFSYTCTGTFRIGDDDITCPYAHGRNLSLEDCLACSCNGAYAVLALELDGKTLGSYMETAGLLNSLEVCGIHSAPGSFEAEDENTAYLGWSGVGQDRDLVNPCSMLAFVGSIANRGVAVTPQLVEKETLTGSVVPAAFPDSMETYRTFNEQTCSRLKEMMRNNVVSQYGQEQFGDLPVCAKSGTAEVGGADPHAWFVGFVDDDDFPMAFVVLVENGGWGSTVAGSVAAQVLSAAAAEKG